MYVVCLYNNKDMYVVCLYNNKDVYVVCLYNNKDLLGDPHTSLIRNRVHNFIAKNLFATFSSEQYMWND